MSKQFYFKQFSLALVHSLVLFNPKVGPYQLLPLRTRLDLGMMAINEYPVFPKALVLLKPHHQIFGVIPSTLVGESYPSLEMQSVYSAAPADGARCL